MSRSDPGLQPQRTTLAWHRTCLALTANGLLILRAGMLRDNTLMLILGGGVLALCVLVLLLTQQRQRSLLRISENSATTQAARPAILCVTVACALATLGGLLAILPANLKAWLLI